MPSPIANLEHLTSQEKKALLARLLAENKPASLSLSFAQQRLWFLDQLEPDSPQYNMPAAIHLDGKLNFAALQRTLDALVARHETLRTTFSSAGENPVQVINPPQPVALTVVDLSSLEGNEQEQELTRQLKQEAAKPFNLSRDLMLRPVLFRLSEEHHVLLLNLHHIASDEWSLHIIFREFGLLYDGILKNETAPLPPLPISYHDYAHWQRQWLRGEVLAKQLSYWKKQLEGRLPIVELPTDHPRPAIQTYTGAWEFRTFPLTLANELKSFSRQEGMTFFMTLLAAFKTLLWRYLGQDDLTVGSPIAGRNRIETENLVGFFVNTLVFRTKFTSDLTFLDLLRQVREVTVGAYAHQDLPFERLVEELHPERSSRYSPIVQVLFAVQNGLPEAIDIPGAKARLIHVDNGTAKFDLTMFVRETSDGLVAAAEYNTDLFESTTIKRLLAHFQMLLQGIASNPRQRLATLPMLTPAENEQMLTVWNSTRTNYPRQATVAELFEAQVEKTPDSVAVIYDSDTITYRELNRRANQLAHHLRRFQVGPESLVGVFLERSIEMVVTFLAILKAGGAYVPLDSSYPKERLAFMIEDAGISVLLSQRRLLEDLPAHDNCRVICVDRDWENIAAEESANPPDLATADNLAYVIYTSGSTGKPKGVTIPHRAIVRLVFNTNYISLDSSDRVAQASNASFDAATFEIWGALLHGAKLVGITRDVALSPAEFGNRLKSEGITTLFLTTALFNQMALDAPGSFSGLKHLLFGGEAVDLRHVQSILRDGPPKRLLHVYGPTESTTFATWHLISNVPAGATTIPIGRPISNTETYVLDRHLQPVPVGLPGELYIGGDGLARGYFHRPDLTADRFIEHPFKPDRQARLYKTGDLVRYLPDGSLEFLGRIDLQVKLRGFRIELGEIEAVLSGHPAIDEVAVVAREDAPGAKRLVAYYVAGKARPTTSELRCFLLELLPEYMVPALFIALDALPLSPNGKIDRKALPIPDESRPGLEKAFVAPRDPVERQLVKLWEKVLGIQPVGISDNFFELGGHSLLAVRLFTLIEKTFCKKLPLATLFQAPTVEQLANVLRRDSEGSSWSLLVEIQGQGSKAPIFWVHSLGGDGGGAFFYYRKLANLLGKDQPSYGIRSPQTPFTSIEKMASHYIDTIKIFQPEGPYYLGGFCFGGNVAFEMARQLRARGEEIGVLALLESEPPNSKSAKIRWTPAVIQNFLINLRYWVKSFFHQKPDEIFARFQRRGRVVQKKIGQLFHSNQKEPSESREIALTDMMDMTHYPKDYVKYAEAHWKALTSYSPKPYAGDVTLFRAREQALTMLDPAMGWGALAQGGLSVEVIPGSHEKMLEEPNVQVLACRLQRYLAQARGEPMPE